MGVIHRAMADGNAIPFGLIRKSFPSPRFYKIARLLCNLSLDCESDFQIIWVGIGENDAGNEKVVLSRVAIPRNEFYC